MKILSTRVSDDLSDAIDILSKKKHTNKTEIVRLLLVDGIERHNLNDLTNLIYILLEQVSRTTIMLEKLSPEKEKYHLQEEVDKRLAEILNQCGFIDK